MTDRRDIQITNCHIHTFTTDHAPLYFPVRAAAIFRAMPGLVRGARWTANILGQDALTDRLVRLEKFHRTGSRTSQAAIFKEVIKYYPKSARFVVLPMDMALIGHGRVAKDIRAQHDELAQLARHEVYGSQVIPFGTIHPDRPEGADEFKRVVEDHGFRGLKLYTKLGYAPDHPVLMDDIYPYCIKHNLPVMAHCSRGGVYKKGWLQFQRDKVTEPDAWLGVLEKFKDLRVCLAHFGGESDWVESLSVGFDPHNDEDRNQNWANRIASLLESGCYPNLYTDISYTIFRFDSHIPLLKLYLTNENIRKKVLFGSDFYMTRQEKLSEKEISIRLRDALGEEVFHAIADENPKRWLGEVA